MANELNRLDEIMKRAFDTDLCSFAETLTIILSVHMVGTLEPIGNLEKERQSLVANTDGSKPDDSAFLEIYDWEYVRTSLHGIADSICAAGSDRDPTFVAQELETLARWIRLQKSI